ncbi:MAG: type II restriction endonuclease [bacterium]|nr:type II restriction endonuclease [bacterium]
MTELDMFRPHSKLALAVILLLIPGAFVTAPAQSAAKGSQIAKAGFKNEADIAAKFNNWQADEDARRWLTAMNYRLDQIATVSAGKPHGAKADVEVMIKTKAGTEKKEGVSIKLVSSPNGFNQIDKRWLRQYVKLWSMPKEVESALKLFLGEIPPTQPSRMGNRMFLNELDLAAQKAVVDFFTTNRRSIVSDLIAGDGAHAARWMMVAFKATSNTRWTLKSTDAAVAFFGEGNVAVTRAGNLKIGRVTMQRKGGDAGRDSAKMLQFKINPALIIGVE